MSAARLSLVFTVAAATLVAAAGQLRVSSTNGSGIVAINAGDAMLTWTNGATGSFDIEHRGAAPGEWLPLSYGAASQTVETTTFPVDRSYRLGFTPFPYGIGTNLAETIVIVSNVYQAIEDYGDIICHHFDSGVPWPEALAGSPFPTNMANDLLFRKFNTPAGHSVYLSITPIDILRTELAPYRGEQESLPRPPPWDAYTFNHPDVKEAYYQYCKRMIEFFDPSYTIIGIEVNLLMDLVPSSWPAYRELHTGTWARLKADFPSKPIAVSWTGMDLVDGYTSAIHTQQMAALESMTNHIDFFGLSLHTFISALTAEVIAPVPLLKQIFSLVAGPMAVCETGYPAQYFAVSGGTIEFNGTKEKQAQFFRNLFTALDFFDARFVINFIAIDYDQLWNEMGQPDDFNKLWRDTGMLDENLEPRPALRVWRGRLALPHQE